jgi:hypothetical protein
MVASGSRCDVNVTGKCICSTDQQCKSGKCDLSSGRCACNPGDLCPLTPAGGPTYCVNATCHSRWEGPCVTPSCDLGICHAVPVKDDSTACSDDNPNSCDYPFVLSGRCSDQCKPSGTLLCDKCRSGVCEGAYTVLPGTPCQSAGGPGCEQRNGEVCCPGSQFIGSSAPGCTDIFKDLQNCGGCGNACDRQGASFCCNGVCCTQPCCGPQQVCCGHGVCNTSGTCQG